MFSIDQSLFHPLSLFVTFVHALCGFQAVIITFFIINRLCCARRRPTWLSNNIWRLFIHKSVRYLDKHFHWVLNYWQTTKEKHCKCKIEADIALQVWKMIRAKHNGFSICPFIFGFAYDASLFFLHYRVNRRTITGSQQGIKISDQNSQDTIEFFFFCFCCRLFFFCYVFFILVSRAFLAGYYSVFFQLFFRFSICFYFHKIQIDFFFLRINHLLFC